MASFYTIISNGTAIGTNSENSDQVLYAVDSYGTYALVDVINNNVVKTYTGGNNYDQYTQDGNDKDTINLFTNLNHFDDTDSATQMIKDWYIGKPALQNLESKYQQAVDASNMFGTDMPTKSSQGHDKIYVIDGITYKWDGDSEQVTKYEASNTSSSSNIEKDPSTEVADTEDAKTTHNFIDESYYESKMATFQNTINQIQNDLNNGRAIYTMYMKFSVGAYGKGQQVLVDTTSKDWMENCFIDFTHEKNGSGLANQFTLSVMFKPNDRGVQSAMAFEKKLLTVSASQILNNNSKTKALIGCCEFQYGYDNLNIKSPIYTGLFTKYERKIENGNLRFTIHGNSNACLGLERRLSTKEAYMNGCSANTPFKFLENIVLEEFEDVYKIEYCGGVKASDPHCATDDFMHFSQKTFFQVISDTLSAAMSNNDDPKGGPSTTGPTSPINHKLYEQGMFKVDPMDKQIYTFFLDDSKEAQKNAGVSGGIIWISLLTKPNSDSEASKYKAYITFNWFGYGSGINHLVKDWNPQYDGSVLMALAYSVEKEKINEYLVMDKDGNLVNTTSLGASRVGLLDQGGGEKILNIALEYDNWSRATQYPYKANMTLIGIPCEIPILGIINVKANLVHGSITEKDHSSGDYMILKIIDKMNSSGFWTSLELFKTNVENPDLNVISNTMDEIIINDLEKEESDLSYRHTEYYIENGNYYAVSTDKNGEKSLSQITKEEYYHHYEQKQLHTGSYFDDNEISQNILSHLSDAQYEDIAKNKNNYTGLENIENVNDLLRDGYGYLWYNGKKLDFNVRNLRGNNY